MKRIGIMAVCALAGILLALTVKIDALVSFLELFAKIGGALRALSLQSAAGNGTAWALYGLFCALPLLGLLPLRHKRGWADGLFLLAAAYSLWLWLMLANPTRLIPGYYAGCEGIYGIMSGSVLVSLCLGGVILRLAENTDSASLLRRTRWIILLIAALAALAWGIGCAARTVSAQGALEVGYALWLCLCSAAQTAAVIWALLGADELLAAMGAGWFTEESAKQAHALSARARLLLISTITCTLLANLAALVMSGRVTNSTVQFSPPILELMEAMCCMLLARFIGDGARIKAENDEFV